MNKREARRIMEEARANVERLKDAESQFAADREAQGMSAYVSPEPAFESINERHRREIAEQEEQFELARLKRKRAERRQQQADWSQWEQWADAKIASAIAEERRQVCTAIGDEVRKAIAQIYEDIGDEVKELRIQILNLQSALDQSVTELRGLVKSDGAKVIEMPNQRRASN